MKTLLTLLALVFIMLNYSVGLAQAPSSMVAIKELDEQGFLLDKGWKFQAGDNPQWREPEFDDKSWQSINPTKDIMDIPELWKTDIGWFRLRFTVDSSLTQKGLVLLVKQTGASEIYLNGRLLKQFGKIKDNGHKVQSVSTQWGRFIEFPVSKGEQVLAVKFALQKNLPYVNTGGQPAYPTLFLQILRTQGINRYLESDIGLYIHFLRAGLFLILSVLHLALFLYNPTQIANLYFLIYTFLSCLIGIFGVLHQKYVIPTSYMVANMIFFVVAFYSSFMFFLTAAYETFHYRRGLVYWVIGAFCFLGIMVGFTHYDNGFSYGSLILPPLIYLQSIRITLLAIKEKQRGAKLVMAGAVSFLVFYSLFALVVWGYLPAGPYWLYGNLAINIALLSMPIAISVYLALESSFASRSLGEKLKEVELLSQRTIEQEQEKQQLLAVQNETLEKKVTERTTALRQSLQELKETQAQLIQKEKMASLGELTAGIAHEIQNPLNFVHNFSEVNAELITEMKGEIAKGNMEGVKLIAKDIEENEQKISHHSQRADAIVKGMLQHARTSSGEKQLTDINVLAEEYLRLSYHGLRAKDTNFNANLITELDMSIGKVEVVPQEIGRVLLNLYNNAFYATQQKKSQLNGQYQPEVKVSTSCQDGKIEIRIRDNGCGIPDAVKHKIFQPFFTTKPTGQGTGLGLSLSYDIITKGHGGELKVETKEGEGAEFIVTLPIT